jgi:hypothetical protein
MKEEFVTYLIALALKELGFDKPCFGYYGYNGVIKFPSINNGYELWIKNTPSNAIAPLWQDAIDFFREKYNLNIFFFKGENSKFRNVFSFCILNTHYTLVDFDFENGTDFITIREQAILKTIEIIKNDSSRF